MCFDLYRSTFHYLFVSKVHAGSFCVSRVTLFSLSDACVVPRPRNWSVVYTKRGPGRRLRVKGFVCTAEDFFDVKIAANDWRGREERERDESEIERVIAGEIV